MPGIIITRLCGFGIVHSACTIQHNHSRDVCSLIRVPPGENISESGVEQEIPQSQS